MSVSGVTDPGVHHRKSKTLGALLDQLNLGWIQIKGGKLSLVFHQLRHGKGFSSRRGAYVVNPLSRLGRQRLAAKLGSQILYVKKSVLKA